MRLRWVLAVALLATALGAWPAYARTDEFSTFDPMAPESDIKNALDYYLARPPETWRSEWEDSTGGVRSDQGCMTSGIWYQLNEYKARAPLGDRSWLDVGFQQHADPAGTWEYLRFDFARALGNWGSFAGRFQPAYDKSEHDFALVGQYGQLRSPLVVRATFTLVDAFNSFWEFRQSLVGTHSTPYRAHPFQPELTVLSRGARHRLELTGKWLTPSRKAIDDPDPAVAGQTTLWGSKVFALAEGTLGRWTGIARFEGTQVLSTHETLALAGDGRVYRRGWIAEGGVRGRWSPRLTAEAHYLYGNRAEDWRPPSWSGSFHALDRMAVAEATWQVRGDWALRSGLMYDRVGVVVHGYVPDSSWGTRKKSRAFIGLQARFGRVRVMGIEGIDLDHEPYPVTFHHDKGFLHLQTSF